MKRLSIICAVLFLGIAAHAQNPKLSVAVSSDTLLLGNYLELKFTVENAPATSFEPPDLSGFYIVGGPNTSTSMSIVNGEVSQSSSYTYYLEPPEIGVYTIEPAYLTVGETIFETPPIDIVVSPNPDGIIKPPHSAGKRFDQIFPPINLSEDKDTLPKKPRKKF